MRALICNLPAFLPPWTGGRFGACTGLCLWSWAGVSTTQTGDWAQWSVAGPCGVCPPAPAYPPRAVAPHGAPKTLTLLRSPCCATYAPQDHTLSRLMSCLEQHYYAAVTSADPTLAEAVLLAVLAHGTLQLELQPAADKAAPGHGHAANGHTANGHIDADGPAAGVPSPPSGVLQKPAAAAPEGRSSYPFLAAQLLVSVLWQTSNDSNTLGRGGRGGDLSAAN